MKRVFLFVFTLALLLSACALGETYKNESELEFPESLPYSTEGVVERGVIQNAVTSDDSELPMPLMVKGAADITEKAYKSELEVAYVSLDGEFLVRGQESTWTIQATGGDGRYRYKFALYYRASQSVANFTQVSAQSTASTKNTFSYTPTQSKGQFMLLVYVYDDSGSEYLMWKSQVWECVLPNDASDVNTISGRVTYIVNQCKQEAGTGSYARALWLHDWLTEFADYDTSENASHYADGVLLNGKGVCQSYALAYQMLCRKIGIECLYVTGEASSDGKLWVSHAWNMIRINGEWYHVDCTWDDPLDNSGEGGHENHNYFCVTDEFMANDHRWAAPPTTEHASTEQYDLVPPCTDEEMSYAKQAGYILVASEQEVKNALSAMASAEKNYGYLFYTGKDAAFDLYQIVYKWMRDDKPTNVTNKMMSMNNREGSVLMAFNGETLGNLNKVKQISLSDSTLSLSAGRTYRLTYYALPVKPTVVNWSTSDSTVASVNASTGLVTAKATGIAVITLNGDGIKAVCVVTVGNVKQVQLPASLKVLEEGAFENCESFVKVYLPDGLEYIGSCAFTGNAKLMEIHIPSTVTYIADDAFFGLSVNFTIFCEEGSYAESFADSHGISYLYE